MKRLAAGIAAAALIAATTVAARAQNNVISYVDFIWLNYSQATCLQRGEAAVNEALTAFGITGATTRSSEWAVLANTPDLNFWVFCITAADGLVDANAERVLVISSVNSGRADIDGTLRDYLADCMETACPGAAPTTATTIGWIDGAQAYRGQNGALLDFFCPARDTEQVWAIWGTDIYTDDSAICVAGLHAGVIGAGGGVVTIEILPGLKAYVGSERNGITSQSWGAYEGSYRVVQPG